jgi:hypothetical protein
MAANVIVAYWGNFHPDILQSPSLVPRRGMGILPSPSDRSTPETRRSGPHEKQAHQ